MGAANMRNDNYGGGNYMNGGQQNYNNNISN